MIVKISANITNSNITKIINSDISYQIICCKSVLKLHLANVYEKGIAKEEEHCRLKDTLN